MANKDFEFSWSFKNFAIRTVHMDYKDKTSSLRKNYPIELIKYFDDTHSSCYTVAYFALDEEGYELHFMGNRPLKNITPEEMKSIWSQLQAAQTMLDAYFEACQKAKEDDNYDDY